MSEIKNLPFETESHGAVIVKEASICNGTIDGGIIAVNIDMKSTNIDVIQGSSGIAGEPSTPEIVLKAQDRSLHLDESKERDAYTILKFTTLKGWHIWCCNSDRYSVYVCFVKD